MRLQKIIQYGIYTAMVLPLAFTSRTKYPWHFGKTVLFQILVEILLALAAIYFAFLSTHRRGNFANEKQQFKFTWLDSVFYLFILAQFISAIFGVNFIRSFWGDQARAQGVFTWLHFAAFYFLIRQFIVQEKDWRRLGTIVIAVSAVSSVIAWIGPHLDFFQGIVNREGRLGGMIGNPIFLASYITIPLFLSLVWTARERRASWRWVWLVIAALDFVTLIFTGTRGAFLGLLLASAVMFAAYFFLYANRKAKFILGGAGLAAIGIIAALFIFTQRSDYLVNKAPVFGRLFQISFSTDTGSTRLMAWEIALKGWKERPLLGWGGENYRDIFDKYYNPEFLKHAIWETVWDKPHSFLFEVASSFGTVGAVAYLSSIIILFVYIIKLIGASKDFRNKLPFILLGGGAVAYLVQNFIAFETSNSLLLWVVLVAAVSFTRQSFSPPFKDEAGGGLVQPGTARPHPSLSSAEEREGYETPFLRHRWQSFASKLAFVSVIIFAIFSPYALYANYQMFHASVLVSDASDASTQKKAALWKSRAEQVLRYSTPHRWENAIFLTQDLGNMDVNGLLNKEMMQSVGHSIEEILAEQMRLYPQSFFFRFWLGQLYGMMGEYFDPSYYGRSTSVLTEAGHLSPDRPQIPLMLAKNYLLQNQDQKAIEILRELVKRYPGAGYQEPHWFLGVALAKSGDKRGGVEEMEKGTVFAFRHQQNVALMIDLYAELKEYQKIIPLYERLIKENPWRAAEYYANLAAVYAELQDEEKMVYYLNLAIELDSSIIPEAKAFLKKKGIDIRKYL